MQNALGLLLCLSKAQFSNSYDQFSEREKLEKTLEKWMNDIGIAASTLLMIESGTKAK